MADLFTPQFLVSVLQIILINILLSGDNAVVIALACRNLPDKRRRKGILWGVLGAIVLRIVLTFFAMSLLAYPYLKLIGARAADMDRHQADRRRRAAANTRSRRATACCPRCGR